MKEYTMDLLLDVKFGQFGLYRRRGGFMSPQTLNLVKHLVKNSKNRGFYTCFSPSKMKFGIEEQTIHHVKFALDGVGVKESTKCFKRDL